MPVAPLNRLSMLTDRISPKTARVPCPNQDVIYGFGMFDLAADAVVVQVPDPLCVLPAEGRRRLSGSIRQ